MKSFLSYDETFQSLEKRDGSTETYWDVIFNREKYITNQSSNSPYLLLDLDMTLFEVQKLSNGAYAPRQYWRNKITVHVVASVMFNSYGLITAVQQNFQIASAPCASVSTALACYQSHIRKRSVELPPYPESSLQPQVYPKHTVESVTELNPSVLTSPVCYVPYNQPEPVHCNSTLAYSPHPCAVARLPPPFLASVPQSPLGQHTAYPFGDITRFPDNGFGYNRNDSSAGESFYHSPSPLYPRNNFGYNRNYSSAGENHCHPPSHLYPSTGQYTPFDAGADERPSKRGHQWKCPIEMSSLKMPDMDIPPPL